jgi:hypothetical protein
MLTKHIESVIRSTNYRGHIQIGFQLAPRTITVQTNSLLNRLRHNKFFYWFCIIFQLWVITWPILFFMTKRWAVVTVGWEYARFVKHPNGQVIRRDFWQISEHDWIRKYQYTIKNGVLSCAKNGTFLVYTSEDTAIRREIDREARGASEPQGGFVGGALSLMRGVGNIVRESQEARGWGYDD